MPLTSKTLHYEVLSGFLFVCMIVCAMKAAYKHFSLLIGSNETPRLLQTETHRAEK